MKRYGIIDLGSNSIRLVVFEIKDELYKRLVANTKKERKSHKAQESDGAREKLIEVAKGDFAPLLSTKKTAGLSSYVVNGEFSEDGIRKASDILSEFIERAHLMDCANVKVFATAVLRNCDNSKDAVKAIEHKAKCKIDVLPGHDEAFLDYVGAMCWKRTSNATLIDIGGGSTELVRIKGGKGAEMVSLDQGCISSFAKYVKIILPTKSECNKISRAFIKRLDTLPDKHLYECKKLIGVGGSIRAAAKLFSAIDGETKTARELSKSQIDDLYAMMLSKPSEFAHLAAKAVPDRLHSIGCSLVLIKVLMDEFSAESLMISKYGVREGYLIRMLSETDQN